MRGGAQHSACAQCQAGCRAGGVNWLLFGRPPAPRCNRRGMRQPATAVARKWRRPARARRKSGRTRGAARGLQRGAAVSQQSRVRSWPGAPSWGNASLPAQAQHAAATLSTRAWLGGVQARQRLQLHIFLGHVGGGVCPRAVLWVRQHAEKGLAPPACGGSKAGRGGQGGCGRAGAATSGSQPGSQANRAPHLAGGPRPSAASTPRWPRTAGPTPRSRPCRGTGAGERGERSTQCEQGSGGSGAGAGAPRSNSRAQQQGTALRACRRSAGGAEPGRRESAQRCPRAAARCAAGGGRGVRR